MEQLGILDFSSLFTSPQAQLWHINCKLNNPPPENQQFFKNVPSPQTFENIPDTDKNWHSKVIEQGKIIRNVILEQFPLAFKQKDDHSPSCATSQNFNQS